MSADDPTPGGPPPRLRSTAFPRQSRWAENRKRTRSKRQIRTGWVMLLLGGLMVVTAAWVLVTAIMARSELTAMKSDLVELRQQLSAGDFADAKPLSASLAKHAQRAHELTSGPAWWAVAEIPGVGDPFESARGVSDAVKSLSVNALPQVVNVTTAIDPSNFKLTDHTVDLSSLIQKTPELDAANAELQTDQRRLNALPHHTWLSPVNDGLGEVSTALAKLSTSMRTADTAAHSAPALLGYSSPQRYFVGFQNEAEARGTGGIPGAFGILVADHGKLTFTHFGSDSEFDGVDSGVTFSDEYDQAWQGFDPTSTYLNSGVDPDFRFAGQIWATMWEKKSGEHVNGAISLDPTALSYLLAVTGPAALPDGTQVSAGNIVSLTQSTVYAQYTDQNARRQYLLTVAQAADQKVLAGAANAKDLFKAANRAATERRLLLWSEDKSVEASLDPNLAGIVSGTSSPYVGPVVIDYDANKLTYYLKTDVQWSSTACGDARDVTVTFRLTNTAPTGLPAYVTARSDNPSYPVQPGDNLVLVYYLGSAGGSLDDITIGGAAAPVVAGTEGVHPTYATVVEIPRGTTQTVVMHLTEPATSAKPEVLRQPLVNPMTIGITTKTC